MRVRGGLQAIKQARKNNFGLVLFIYLLLNLLLPRICASKHLDNIASLFIGLICHIHTWARFSIHGFDDDDDNDADSVLP